jgi:hypothetical protein
MGGANEKRLPHRPNARGSPPTLLSEARRLLELGLLLALLFGGCAIGLLIPVLAIAVQRSCLSLPTIYVSSSCLKKRLQAMGNLHTAVPLGV